MSGIRWINSALKRLASDKRGSVSIMYALSLVPIIAAAGVAIDYVRVSAARTELQAALDAGTLAGAAVASGATDASRIAQAKATFDATLAGGSAASMKSNASFRIEDGTLISAASLEVPMSLLKVAGINAAETEVQSTVKIATEKHAEVVMALDYSGSMADKIGGKMKYVSMREAAGKLVDDLSSSLGEKVKFGLVPFSHHVYTSLPNAFVAGMGNSGTWTGCTQDRQYPFNISSSSPNGSNASKWGQPQAPDHLSYGCSGYITNQLSVMDLTDKPNAVKAKLGVMAPYAWTHIAVGAEFGYHMLTPNAPYTEAAPLKDGKTEKILVLLTDGEQTEPAFGPGKIRTVEQGGKNLEAICSAAKADGITVVTMAFDLDDSTTRKRLQNCASDPAKNFFVVDDGAELAKAFESVRNTVTAQIYLSN